MNLINYDKISSNSHMSSNKFYAQSKRTLEFVGESLANDKFWKKHLLDASVKNTAVHLGVFIEPFLTFILEGKKTIESRFSKNRISPFEQVNKNDILLLKKSGGEIKGICRIKDAWFYHLDKDSWKDIRYGFEKQLCITDSNFWQIKQDASYASLMLIDQVRAIPSIKFKKQDRRGWIVLSKNSDQLRLFN